MACVVAVVSVLVVAAAAVEGDRTRPDDPMFEDQWALENTGQLLDLGLEVERVAGTDRYGTSVAAAEAALARHPAGDLPVVFATGDNFPDGLAAGALAAHLRGLLLLVPQTQLSDTTSVFLAEHASRLDVGVVVGGEVAVSDAVRRAVENAMRTE